MSQAVKGRDGHIHFAYNGRHYRMHADKPGVEVAIYSGNLWEPSRWAPAALRWAQIPRPLRNAIMAIDA